LALLLSDTLAPFTLQKVGRNPRTLLAETVQQYRADPPAYMLPRADFTAAERANLQPLGLLAPQQGNALSYCRRGRRHYRHYDDDEDYNYRPHYRRSRHSYY
jgi:hypothetical protein